MYQLSWQRFTQALRFKYLALAAAMLLGKIMKAYSI